MAQDDRQFVFRDMTECPRYIYVDKGIYTQKRFQHLHPDYFGMTQCFSLKPSDASRCISQNANVESDEQMRYGDDYSVGKWEYHDRVRGLQGQYCERSYMILRRKVCKELFGTFDLGCFNGAETQGLHCAFGFGDKGDKEDVFYCPFVKGNCPVWGIRAVCAGLWALPIHPADSLGAKPCCDRLMHYAFILFLFSFGGRLIL